MKVIHGNNGVKEQAGNGLSNAKQLEQEGELEKAAAAFEKVIREEPLNEYAYTRLMIIYRKTKNYKKELVVIKKGIRAFEKSLKSASRVTVTKKIATLSKYLLKSLGLADKKGNALYKGEPLDRWIIRKAVVERLLKKKQG
jgi:tetratricopeptide (TPR) repeat protein